MTGNDIPLYAQSVLFADLFPPDVTAHCQGMVHFHILKSQGMDQIAQLPAESILQDRTVGNPAYHDQ